MRSKIFALSALSSRIVVLLVGCVIVTTTASAQVDADSTADPLRRSLEVSERYRLVPDVTYLEADGHESKLDLIAPRDSEQPLPTLLYIHGGGWVQGSKDAMFLHFLPWLEMGYAVVNVGYRLAEVALAPAAVEDGRCALRWTIENAERYGLDPGRIVVSGHSAGGHLSLTTGLLPASAGLDRRCPVRAEGGGVTDAALPEMPVAAVVNWFGITDVVDLIEGPEAKTYAVVWLGSRSDREEVARRVSPLTWVRPGVAPVLTIHGNADGIVPYDHAVRLHRALDEAGVPNRLHTIEGGGHGGFTVEEQSAAFTAIRDFLERHVTGDPADQGSDARR